MNVFRHGPSQNKQSNACIVLALCFCNGIRAEQTKDSKYSLEPIIVSTQKRPEHLVDVPVSVSVVSAEKINAMGMHHLEDLSSFVANMTVTQNAVYNKIFIRGIGSGLNLGFEQSVGTFVDGIYTGRGRQTGMPLLDVERVEVLKGSQGILFGKNTTAGAVNIITAKPTDTFTSQFSALYAPGHQERDFSGFVSGPLCDKLSGRIAARFVNMEGFVRNTADNYNIEPNTESQSVRGTLQWDPVDQFELIAKYEFSHSARDGSTFQVTDASGFDALFKAGDPAFDDEFNLARSVAGDGRIFGDDFNDTTAHQAAMTAHLNFSDYLLSSVTGFNSYQHKENFDADISALAAITQNREEAFYQFSQEIRLHSPAATEASWIPWNANALDYIVGAYYQYQDMQFITKAHADFRAYSRLGLAFPRIGSSRVNQTDQQSHLWALFSQVSWHPIDDVKLTAGLRYTGEVKSAAKKMIIANLGTNTANPTLNPLFTAFNTVPHQFNATLSEAHITPMFNSQWFINQDDRVYFNFSTGNKGGGFDDNATSGIFADYQFTSENTVGYEVGAKTNWFNGKLNLNLALFRTDFKNLQVSEFDGVASFIVGNAASAVSQGVELDGRWQITDGLSFSSAVAYLDTHYNDFQNAACNALQTSAFQAAGGSGACFQDLSGRKTRYAPEWSGNITIEYRIPFSQLGFSANMFSGLELSTLFNINVTDSYYLTSDLDPRLQQPGFAKLNLRIAVADKNGQWEIAFLGKNLTNRLTSNDGNDVAILTGPVAKLTERPLSLAVQGRVSF